MSQRPARFSVLIAVAAALVVTGVVVAVVVGGRGGRRSRPATATALAPPPGTQFGTSVNRLFNDRTFSNAQINVQLIALAATGATLARTDALWELAEPQAPVGAIHRYDWSFDDVVAGALAAHHVRWLAIADYAAPWAAATAAIHSAPRSAADYAAFAAAFARRYGRGGTFWSDHPALPAEPVETYEIWNEPDNPVFWKPSPDASSYAKLYLAARAAIKTVDPAARVIVGGLTEPARFLPAMLTAHPDLAASLDGVAIHPYGSGPEAVLRSVRRARTALDALGMQSVPLYVTEVGWTTLPPGALSWAPARLRGRYLVSTLTSLGHSDCGIAAVVVYTWVTPERDPRNREDWFGIHSPTGEPNPDTAAFAQGVRDAERPGVTFRVCAGG